MIVNMLNASEYRIREDLVAAHEEAWQRVVSSGTWLTGERRLAVVKEIRRARERSLCAKLRETLSPDSVEIKNSSNGRLSESEVELINRVVCDPGRLTESWVNRITSRELTEYEYIEIVGIIAIVMVLDTFTLGVGLSDSELPKPGMGDPTFYSPPGARKKAAWLPIVEPEDVAEEDGPMYPSPKAGYILRALSGVPQSLRDYWAMANIHYLPGKYVYQFDSSIRAIDRMQIELIASKVSALHQCAY